jgi:hypothetical protein
LVELLPRVTKKWSSVSLIAALRGLLTILWIVAMVFFGIRQWPTGIRVEPPFEDIYKRNAWALGKPKDNSMDAHGAVYQGRYQHATNLWANVFSYVLWEGGQMWEPLGESTPPVEDKWKQPDWLKEHFHPAKVYGPPEGSMAYNWDKDHHWKKMGWMEWHCVRTPNILYQDFDHGRLIGVFRASLTSDAGIIYALLDNHKWWEYEIVTSVPNITKFAPADISGCSMTDK